MCCATPHVVLLFSGDPRSNLSLASLMALSFSLAMSDALTNTLV
jgi:hypothetical protein